MQDLIILVCCQMGMAATALRPWRKLSSSCSGTCASADRTLWATRLARVSPLHSRSAPVRNYLLISCPVHDNLGPSSHSHVCVKKSFSFRMCLDSVIMYLSGCIGDLDMTEGL